MSSAPSALLPILRSQVAGDLLALLYLHPDEEYSLTEAASAIDAKMNTAESLIELATRLLDECRHSELIALAQGR
jgi:hypothetical protein